MGFAIRPPDVNASRWEYTVEGAGGAALGAEGPSAGMRVGLCQLRDIRRPFVDRLLEERARGDRSPGSTTSCGARTPGWWTCAC